MFFMLYFLILKLQSVLILMNWQGVTIWQKHDMSEFDKNAMCGVFTEKTRMDDLIEKWEAWLFDNKAW